MRRSTALRKLFATFEVNPIKIFKSLVNIPGYISDYIKFSRQLAKYGAESMIMPCAPSYPCLTDRDAQGGTASGHYFWQDLLVAQRIHHRNPEKHLDIGSRVDGFVAHVASFRSLDVLDIRPITLNVKNINFIQGDITDAAAVHHIGTYDSVSCLHALEHVGLGRYGDKINPIGHINAAEVISSLVKVSGILHLSVPIGNQRIEFNAHRIFNPNTIVSLFEKYGLKLLSFCYVNDSGEYLESSLVTSKSLDVSVMSLAYQGRYGCGIFEFEKS
jgi:hypothetical protein